MKKIRVTSALKFCRGLKNSEAAKLEDTFDTDAMKEAIGETRTVDLPKAQKAYERHKEGAGGRRMAKELGGSKDFWCKLIKTYCKIVERKSSISPACQTEPLAIDILLEGELEKKRLIAARQEKSKNSLIVCLENYGSAFVNAYIHMVIGTEQPELVYRFDKAWNARYYHFDLNPSSLAKDFLERWNSPFSDPPIKIVWSQFRSLVTNRIVRGLHDYEIRVAKTQAEAVHAG